MFHQKNHKVFLYLLILSLSSLLTYTSNAVVFSDISSDEGVVIEINDKLIKRDKSTIQIVAKPIDNIIINRDLPNNMFVPKDIHTYVIFARDADGRIITGQQIKGKFTIGFKYPRDIKPDLARNLKVFMLSRNGWVSLESNVDTFQRIVKTQNAEQLGVYRLLAPLDLDLKDVYIYPNPVQFGTFGDVTKSLKFQNVPLGSKIEIYTVSGEKIHEIKGVTSTQVLWNGKRDNGDLITSGLYIYRIQTAGGEKFGKIAVIR